MWRSASARRMSRRTLLILNAATFAILPLLALPWADSTTAVILLLVIAAGVFVFEMAISKLSMRFDKTNAPPSGSGS
jgi:hypothetical protein